MVTRLESRIGTRCASPGPTAPLTLESPWTSPGFSASLALVQNSPVIYLLLIIAAFFTSVISGVLSMAGGMILMGVFGFFLSVPAAMVLHGVAQAVSNGSRVWIYRRRIRWALLIPYSLGALIVLAGFVSFTFVPDIGLLFVLIGLFPFLALALPDSINLDMQKKPVAFLSGLVVTLAQMLAGASGPVLDIFYVKSSLTKEEVLGTKAITQTLGHVIKLIYYAGVMRVTSLEIPWWVLPAVVVAAILGNYAGSLIVAGFSDRQFKTIGRVAIMIIGAVYLGKGLYELITG